MNIALALAYGWPTAQWSCLDGTYSTLSWNDDGEKPTESAIKEAWVAYQEAMERVEYIERRRAEYPALGDQLDAIWKELNYRRMNGENLIQEADNILNQILAVKARHPKKDA